MTSHDDRLQREAGRLIDIVDMFGPMAGMHAAFDRLGAGMPCGLAARLIGVAPVEVESAIDDLLDAFPILRSGLAWRAERPVLALPGPEGGGVSPRTAAVSLDQLFNGAGPIWRYALHQDRGDTWFSAVWAHASADGLSMLGFLDALAARLHGRTLPPSPRDRTAVGTPRPLATWLPRFLIERKLPYLRVAGLGGAAGVSWLSLSPEATAEVLEAAAEQGVGVAARLSAAAALVCAQAATGRFPPRVCINLLVARPPAPGAERFGFSVGSLLIPTPVTRDATLAGLAAHIDGRQRRMRQEGWDLQLERLIGRDPVRHLRFAALETRGVADPRINISWKGVHPELAGGGRARDIACFSRGAGAHLSAHVDANGLSLSLSSTQSAADREALLIGVATTLGDRSVARVLTLDGLPAARANAELDLAAVAA